MENSNSNSNSRLFMNLMLLKLKMPLLFKIDSDNYVFNKQNILVVENITPSNMLEKFKLFNPYIKETKQKIKEMENQKKKVNFRENEYDIKINGNDVILTKSFNSDNDDVKDCCYSIINLSFKNPQNLLILLEIFDPAKN